MRSETHPPPPPLPAPTLPFKKRKKKCTKLKFPFAVSCQFHWLLLHTSLFIAEWWGRHCTQVLWGIRCCLWEALGVDVLSTSFSSVSEDPRRKSKQDVGVFIYFFSPSLIFASDSSSSQPTVSRGGMLRRRHTDLVHLCHFVRSNKILSKFENKLKSQANDLSYTKPKKKTYACERGALL